MEKIGVAAFLFWICFASGLGAQLMRAHEPSDSIVTFGTSLTARGGWQHALAERLSSCLRKPISVDIVAQGGATSGWGLDHVKEVVRYRPGIVLIEFYANDATIHRFISVERSRQTFAEILARLRAELPDARLIVQIMNPFWGVRRMARPFLDSYIEAHLQEAVLHKAEIVDHRPAWSTLTSSALATAIPDGVHPLSATATAIIVPTLGRLIVGSSCP